MKIAPFNDYYMNCYLNNLFTILTNIDDSYRMLAYENNYYYHFKQDDMPSYLGNNGDAYFTIEYLIEPYISVYNIVFNKNVKIKDNLDFPYLGAEAYQFGETDDFLNETEGLLNEDYILFVGVDLYDLIPRSSLYHKIHRDHYTMMYGYEPESQVFKIMDEGPLGYGIQTIKREKFINAINNSTLETKCFVYKMNTILPAYKTNKDKIIKNSQRIYNEIGKISLNSIITASTYKNVNVESINRIAHRQRANELMINGLVTKGFLCKNTSDFLQQKANKIYTKWLGIRNEIIKLSITKKAFCLSSVKDEIECQINDEFVLWKLLLDIL